MNLFFYRLLFILNICLLQSCSTIDRKLYSPTQINTPSLQKKNDHNFAGSISAPGAFDFHASYALTNRLAIIGGLFTHRNQDEEEAYSIFSSYRAKATLLYKHKGFHIGTGAYIPLIVDNSSLFISGFGTYTDGDFTMNETSNNNSIPGTKYNFYSSDLKRWALQSSLHFYSKHVHQALTARYSHVTYSYIYTDYTQTEQQSYRLPPLGHSRFSSFVDFGFDTKVFFSEKQNLGIQVFGSIAARLNHEDYHFDHYPMRIGIGLVTNSPFRKKK